ncbi:tRNA (adenosine(37)-N6)-threonylcarbamoyltransferase complex transferase subunit TsaD [Candidatus Curtissbacteria bacterium]|nr:tRNA (adenosine(37)-N6)-threonylcarbamoyltransferase complex transferase subunit TsaD [Candidatus Curtissbacteria bacterium]
MIILGIESTCDETSAAVVEDGRKILSNVVASSSAMHKKYGGIVPEVAAREQIKVIIPTIDEALQVSGNKYQDLDAIAIAYGPGLIGSLLIGVETARALALAWNKPLIGVNHLVGHIYANWLAPIGISNLPKFPLIALVVSGGHTDLILMKGHGKFKWLGGTRDDSAGEAFDKVARVLGLGYPGGPEIERIARNIKYQMDKFSFENPNIKFPRPMINSKDFDFSFSGLKTAVVDKLSLRSSSLDKLGTTGLRVKSLEFRVKREEIAHEFQEAVTDVLLKKTFAAAKEFGAKSVVVGGGVAANSVLRQRMEDGGSKNNIEVFFPQGRLAVDNGAMIAAAAFYERNFVDPLALRADPGLHF